MDLLKEDLIGVKDIMLGRWASERGSVMFVPTRPVAGCTNLEAGPERKGPSNEVRYPDLLRSIDLSERRQLGQQKYNLLANDRCFVRFSEKGQYSES
jgi:hypothetical protein